MIPVPSNDHCHASCKEILTVHEREEMAHGHMVGLSLDEQTIEALIRGYESMADEDSRTAEANLPAAAEVLD
jgi:hypothetical protein